MRRITVIGGIAVVVAAGAALGNYLNRPIDPKDVYPNYSCQVRADPVYRQKFDDRTVISDLGDGVISGDNIDNQLFVQVTESVTGKEYLLFFKDRSAKRDFDARAANYMVDNQAARTFDVVVNWRDALRQHNSYGPWDFPVQHETAVLGGRAADVIAIYKPGFVTLDVDTQIARLEDIPVVVRPGSVAETAAVVTDARPVAERRRALVAEVDSLMSGVTEAETGELRRGLEAAAGRHISGYRDYTDSVRATARTELDLGR